MRLAEYFDHHKGRGVISTADSTGNVNQAIYATPHCFEDGQIAFIMRDRLTHKNIGENPKACYLFMSDESSVSGIRLYLEKTSEEQDSERLADLHKRRRSVSEENELGPKYLVFFKVNKVLPLIGDGDTDISL